MLNQTADPNIMWGVRLRDLPKPIKLLFTTTLLTLGMGYLFAIGNLALSIGMSQVDVVEHYWGDPEVRAAVDAQQSESDADSGGEEEEMSFDDLDDDVALSAPALAIPSFDSLVAEGHFHMFGFAMIFFICGFIVSFADMERHWKSVLIVTPFIGSFFDVWSTLLTRFIGPNFSWMLMVSGTLMALSFGIIFVISIWQMWFMKKKVQQVGV